MGAPQGMHAETTTMQIVTFPSQPMLCILTRASARASTIASTIKTSLDQVLRFMDEHGIRPAGNPTAMFSDWNDRLVTIEAGYPVPRDSLALAAGRIQTGCTPQGPAVRWEYGSARIDHVRQHADSAAEARRRGLRLTGTTWEVYGGDPPGGRALTQFYAQLIASRESSASIGG